MAYLKFIYGTVNSSKTTNLLMLIYAYNKTKKIALLGKPKIDTFSPDIFSRIGLKQSPDFLIENEDYSYNSLITADIKYLIVDEAQFLSSGQVENLRKLAMKINVICFGLKTDYMNRFFTGSHRLFELADHLEELAAPCHYCKGKASVNMRHDNGIIVTTGEQIKIGKDSVFWPVCYSCYGKQVEQFNFARQVENSKNVQ